MYRIIKAKHKEFYFEKIMNIYSFCAIQPHVKQKLNYDFKSPFPVNSFHYMHFLVSQNKEFNINTTFSYPTLLNIPTMKNP